MRVRTIFALIGIAVTAGCGHGEVAAVPRPELEKIIAMAVASPARTEEMRARDAYRKPAEMLRFSRVAPGDTVVEIAPGGGYYTALLARVVEDDGKIIAVDPKRIFEAFPQAAEGFPKFIAADPQDNVDYSVQNLDDIDLPMGIDQVWMVLYYHDTFWTGENRAEMNRRLYEALRPGGAYFVIDHHGLTGAGAGITQSLHRMDASVAKAEIEAAGFILDAESDALAYPADPRNDSVFSEERRGKTDRFVWRYVKPE